MDAHPRRPSGAGSSAGQATSRPPPHVAENARSISPISHASPGLNMSSLPRRGSAATYRRGGSKRSRTASLDPTYPGGGVCRERAQQAFMPAGSVPGEPHGKVCPLADCHFCVRDEGSLVRHLYRDHYNRHLYGIVQWLITSPSDPTDAAPTPSRPRSGSPEPTRPELPPSPLFAAVPPPHAADHVRQYCPTERQHVEDSTTARRAHTR